MGRFRSNLVYGCRLTSSNLVKYQGDETALRKKVDVNISETVQDTTKVIGDELCVSSRYVIKVSWWKALSRTVNEKNQKSLYISVAKQRTFTLCISIDAAHLNT